MVDIAKNSIGRYSFDRARYLGIKIYKRIQFGRIQADSKAILQEIKSID